MCLDSNWRESVDKKVMKSQQVTWRSSSRWFWSNASFYFNAGAAPFQNRIQNDSMTRSLMAREWVCTMKQHSCETRRKKYLRQEGLWDDLRELQNTKASKSKIALILLCFYLVFQGVVYHWNTRSEQSIEWILVMKTLLTRISARASALFVGFQPS